MGLPELKGSLVRLHLPQPSEAAAVVRFYSENRAYLAPFEPVRGEEFYTTAYWEDELGRRIKDFRQEQSLMFFLSLHENPARLVGSVNFSGIVRRFLQACYLGYNLAPDCGGRGIMTEALGLAIPFVFRELNLHRIMANHLPDNERSARLLARLGFNREGLARDYLLINGTWRDHVLNSLTNPKWAPQEIQPRHNGH